MQHAEREIALGQGADDDAKAENVVDLREGQVLLAHLAVDGEQRLLAAEHLHLQLVMREAFFDVALDAVDDVAPIAARLLHRFRQCRMAPRPQVLERQLLQLAVGLVQAEPVRDRRVDVERFARDAGALVGGHRLHRAHVVQPVGELDEDHAHVARHREQHFAKRLGLRLFAGRELQLVQLREAVDEVGGRRTEALDQLGLGHAAVFHRVVHQRRHDGLRVEFPFGAQAGDCNRVGDVRLAAGAELAEVRLVSEAVGVAHPLDVGRVEVVELVRQRGKRGRCSVRSGRCRRLGSTPPACRSRLLNGGGRSSGHPANLT